MTAAGRCPFRCALCRHIPPPFRHNRSGHQKRAIQAYQSSSERNPMLKYKLNFRDTFPAAAVVKEGSSGLGMLPVELFLEMLCIERKRTERSGRKFVLMLLDPGTLLQAGEAI